MRTLRQILGEAAIAKRLDAIEALKLKPERLPVPLFPKCVLKILMVADGGITFGPGNFGLEELIDILEEGYGPWLDIQVSTAHVSGTEPVTVPDEFSFEDHDLTQYDQIWLFGIVDDMIPAADRKAIADFMNGGGGVFATGDHEDLGYGLCGDVIRVRSMRRWYFPSDITPADKLAGNVPDTKMGKLVAPPVDGPQRHDTTAERIVGGEVFNDQSDDVPQTIKPRYYYRKRLFGKLRWYKFPHPVLCGPNGVITVLPDHAHEGDCHEPTNIAAPYSLPAEGAFPGMVAIDEYPKDASGQRVRPEVIAWSDNGNGIAEKSDLDGKTFGAIGAYDGQRAGVGRIVVDATWHHFLNINLRGRLDTAGNPLPGVQGMGFYASAAGLDAYEDIKAYFRNIAVWLSRPKVKSCVAWRAAWWTRWDDVVAMDLRRVKDPFTELNLDHLRLTGRHALDVLGNYAGQCQSLAFIIEFLPIPLAERVLWPILPPHLFKEIDPRFQRRVDTVGDPISVDFAEAALEAVAGMIIYQIAADFGDDRASVERAAKVEDGGAKLMEKAVRHAIDLAAQDMSSKMRTARSTLLNVTRAMS